MCTRVPRCGLRQRAANVQRMVLQPRWAAVLTLSKTLIFSRIRTFLTMAESIQTPHGLPGTPHDSYTSPDSLRPTRERICIAVNVYVHTKGLARGQLSLSLGGILAQRIIHIC
jgi:hypothetical protein